VTTPLDYAELVRLARRGQRAEQRRKGLIKFVVSFITGWLTTLLYGWLFMLAVGIVHGSWWHAVPTIGYWWAVLLVYLLRGVFAPVNSAKKDS
jgi:hypothetical protein